MKPLVGRLMTGLGLLHMLATVPVLFDVGPWILERGILFAVPMEVPPPPEAVPTLMLIFSTTTGLLLGMLGLAVHELELAGREVPRAIGPLLVATGLAGALLMPLSGFWLAIALGMVAIYRPARHRRDLELLAGSTVVDTARGPVEYAMFGEEGPVILSSHGSPGGYDLAFPILEGYRTLSPSRPGYLRTPIEAGRTAEAQADLFAALLDALEIDRVVVLAVSAGGPAGLAFAARHPDRVEAVIALEAVSGASKLPWLFWPPGADLVLWTAGQLVWRMLGPDALTWMLVRDPAVRARMDDAGRAEAFAILGGGWPIGPRLVGTVNDTEQAAALQLPLEQITAPTLVIHGTADINVPFSHGLTIAQRVPGAQMHAIEGGDHGMPFTHRSEVHGRIRAFLDEVGAAAPR